MSENESDYEDDSFDPFSSDNSGDERQYYRDFMLRVAQGFCAYSLKPATAPLRVRNRTFSRSKCKSCHDISPYKDSRTSKYCDRCNSATCSNHAKILCRQCFAS